MRIQTFVPESAESLHVELTGDALLVLLSTFSLRRAPRGTILFLLSRLGSVGLVSFVLIGTALSLRTLAGTLELEADAFLSIRAGTLRARLLLGIFLLLLLLGVLLWRRLLGWGCRCCPRGVTPGKAFCDGLPVV